MNEVTEKLTPQQEFEKRLGERIRKDIGDLCPDDVLAGLVSRAIEQAFFQERLEPPRNTWSNSTKKEPWLVEMIRELMREQIKAAVAKWLEDNKEQVLKIVEDLIRDGAGKALLDSFTVQMSGPLADLRNSIASQLNIEPHQLGQGY